MRVLDSVGQRAAAQDGKWTRTKDDDDIPEEKNDLLPHALSSVVLE